MKSTVIGIQGIRHDVVPGCFRMGTPSRLPAGVDVFGQACRLAVDEAKAQLGEAEEKAFMYGGVSWF